MVWFPLTVDNKDSSWSFDIVGLLAVVGGSAVEKHARGITASSFGSIPRLLPAPETMLETDRPVRLPSVKDVNVFGVHNGCHIPELNFFANVIHKRDTLKQYEFQFFKISHQSRIIEERKARHETRAKRNKEDVEKNEERQVDDDTEEAVIPLHKYSALNLMTLASIAMTIGLFIWAGFKHDAIALLGLGTMSLSTSMACMSAQWRPILSVRTVKGEVPPGDVVIQTRSGAFVVVECTEEVARELYTGTETCDYVYEGRIHQCLLSASTIFLMAAIIFFSNCSWEIQVAVGIAYIILNFAYWAIALLASPETMWDMKARYEITSTKPNRTKNFTQVLWKSIQATKETDWVRKNNITPRTVNWEGWLAEASMNCGNQDWNPDDARDAWIRKSKEDAVSDLARLIQIHSVAST